ncbi:MAG: orotidine 5'-phosphate decarboxylase / HUMPS family protein [Candidatus Bathyarchaeia archaeon]
MTPGGYHRRLLRIDLTSSEATVEPLDEETLFNYIGGRGLAVKILYDELRAGVDPISAENKLVFMSGPLTGTGFPGSGRVSVASKSPLTGTVFDSSMGGDFGVHLKGTGFDGIVVEGGAENPVYLLVDEGKTRVMDASPLWGMGTSEAEASLRERYENSGTAVIGPAGENLVYIANIVSRGRTAGRGGLGAVMGSKNLKAIVVKGGKKVRVVYREAFDSALRKIRRTVETHPTTGRDGSMARFGTGVLVHRMAVADIMPRDNFAGEHSMDYGVVDGFSGETVREEYLAGRRACFRCPTGCGRVIKVAGRRMKGPEYESVAMLGPNAGFYSYEEEIVPLSMLCDELGLDTISAGNILGFTREIGEIGDLDGALGLLEDIALGKSVFSRGLVEGARKLGREDLAAHVKGLGLPAYDPRGARGIALAYATSNRGGCHLRAYTISPEIMSNPVFVDPQMEEGKAGLVKTLQDVYAVYDSLVACKFHGFALFTSLSYELDDIARVLTALTGLNFTDKGLREAGERVYTLERLFNAREGFTRKDDALPSRFGIDLKEMLDEYYRERGWSDGGIPRSYPPLSEVEYVQNVEALLSPVARIRPPELQVALDLDAEVETICRIAKQSYAGGARIVEAGTPAIKRHGTDRLIPALREAAPQALVVADLKTMDVGNLEARIAFRSGADVAAVLAVGGMNVILEALSEALRNNKAIIIDFIGYPDPLAELQKLVERLKGYEDSVIFCLHRGISDQLKGRGIHEQKQLISEFRKAAGKFTLAIAGGLKEGTMKDVAPYGVDVFIVGSAIYNSTNPIETTRRLLREIEEHYSKPNL